MNYSLLVRPEAERELTEAYQWYESQLDGLGEEFLVCLDAAFALICRQPALFPIVHRNVRRALIRRFPYGVFYSVENNHVMVLAIFHAKRHPRQWQKRT